MLPRPPRSTLPATPFPYTTLFRSHRGRHHPHGRGVRLARLARTRRCAAAMGPRLRATLEAADLPLRREPHHTVAALGGGPDHDRQPAAGHRPARRSEEHTSELQSLMRISYAVFCLKKNTIMT